MIDTTEQRGGSSGGPIPRDDTDEQNEEEEKKEEGDLIEDYPLRDALPVLRDPNDRPGVWKILKSAMGKDITKFCVPVYINEPISMI